MLYEKLLEIQKEIEPIVKSDTNPFFKSRYFDINTLLGVLKPILSKHGLVLTQGLGQFNGHQALITVIRSDKEKEVYELPLPEIADAQKFGALVTYYRRYAIQSLFALEAEDDDGNTVSGKSIPQVAKPVAQVARPVVRTPVQTIHADEPPF